MQNFNNEQINYYQNCERDFVVDNGIFPRRISIITPDFSMPLKDVAVI